MIDLLRLLVTVSLIAVLAAVGGVSYGLFIGGYLPCIERCESADIMLWALIILMIAVIIIMATVYFARLARDNCKASQIA